MLDGTLRVRLGEETVEAALIDAIHALRTREEQALRQVFEDHDSELLGWP